MPISASRLVRALRSGSTLAFLLTIATSSLAAQVPVQVRPGQQLPNPDQARDLLQNQPDLVRQLRDKLEQSGLSQDQVRARLRAAGYPETFLDDYLTGADTSRMVRPGPRTLDAVTALGILSPQEADSLQTQDSLFAMSDSVRQLLDSLRYRHLDSLRADSLADSLEAVQPSGLKVFGVETFRRLSTQFEPMDAGPVDENYQLGPGDVLVLIITGDVEQAHMLEVTREGFVVIPQVGQLHVANLTMRQMEDQLYARLGKVYSGVRRGANARTQFQLSLAKLRKLQVYVAGDVVRPGSYQVSAAGTVLNALYAAGGPTVNGSFRRIDIRRGGKLVDSVDVYDYLTQGMNPTTLRLQSGDVVFVPVHGGFARVAGKVQRPAIYELRPDETLRDLIRYAGGFDPTAYQARVTIHRVLPPASRGSGGRARVVIAVGADQFEAGEAPALPMAPGDSVTVYGVADRIRSFVTVKGNVWVEGEVGHNPGMKLSDAIRLAGGPKPDVYLDRILVTRVRDDSSMIQLRSSFRDSTGTVTDDIVLDEEDEIRVFSRSTFRAERYVAIVGAVRKPGRVPYREGMTVRDAVLLADGLTPDAWLGEAEIARLAQDSTPGSLAAHHPGAARFVVRLRPSPGRHLRRPARLARTGLRCAGHRAPAVRQSSGHAAAGVGAPAQRGDHRPGALPRPLFAALQDRQAERSRRARGGPDEGGVRRRRTVLPVLHRRPAHRRRSSLAGAGPAAALHRGGRARLRAAERPRARRHRPARRCSTTRGSATTSCWRAATRSTFRSSIR